MKMPLIVAMLTPICLLIGATAMPQPHIKSGVTKYLDFKVDVEELLLRAKALPPDKGLLYLKTNLEKMQKDPSSYGIFLFNINPINVNEVSGDPSFTIDIYYGSTNKRAAFRLRKIGIDQYGNYNWIEEWPENKRLPE